jgi:hypothetical protein
MKKKTILSSKIILIIGYISYSLFIVDFRFQKEEFLIKRNYNQNITAFKNAHKYFKNLPAVRLNFDKDNQIDLQVQSNYLFSNSDFKINDSLDNDFPSLMINDSIGLFQLDYKEFMVTDFKIIDSVLLIFTNDSVYNLREFWYLRYSGNQNTDNAKRIFDLVNIDSLEIEQIKIELRKLNCFGYEKDGNSIILNYRTNKIMADAFSYLLQNQTNDSLKIPQVFTREYGMLDSTIYWFHYETNLLIDYFDYMKLENREI